MVGDKVGMGGIVGSCQKCELYEESLENLCPEAIFSLHGTYYDSTRTYGGFSSKLVVHNHYVVRFPENFPLDASAPLLCAGISVYSPMKYYGLEPDTHLGVVGLGALSLLAIKIAKALGPKVTAISKSPPRRKKHSTDPSLLFRKTYKGEHFQKKIANRYSHELFLLMHFIQIATFCRHAAIGTMEYVMDTVSSDHALEPFLALLKANGKFILLGAPDKPLQLPSLSLIYGRKLIGGGMVGGIKETQEMIDFCAKHNIITDIEVIQLDNLNTAMKRLAEGDVKYLFIIDMANSLSS
ncbi:hypothetical protein AMTRI_Chr11g151980 [Amborella trichopoda]